MEVMDTFGYAISKGYSIYESLDPTTEEDWSALKDYHDKCQSYEP